MIEKKNKRCIVTIFGNEYSLITNESENYVSNAAQRVNELMNEIAGASTAVDEKKIAILAALRLASELMQLKETVEGNSISQRKLIAAIDHELTVMSQRANKSAVHQLK
jgi:cell division protein ZapA